MRIGIDYSAAVRQGAGIGRYSRELVRATVAAAPDDQFRLFYPARDLPDGPLVADLRALCAAYPHVRAVPIPLPSRLLTILWQRLRLPLLAEWFTGPLDLLHAPDFVLPPTRAKTILTIHDLTFLVRPDCAEPALARYLASAVPRSLARADLILADSQATAADLTRLLQVASARIHLLYPGVGPQFRPMPAEQTTAVRERLQLPKRFVLFVATLEPRKNIERLVEGFARYCAATGDAELGLVIGGRLGWRTEGIVAALSRPDLAGRIRRLDFVADGDLPALYNLAEVFAYPSLYEGFGLPALEALACGTPVLSSAVSSLPEVLGTAAILINPEDPDAIANGLATAFANQTDLRQRGPLQARSFRWERAATDLLNCYRAVAATSRHR